MSTGFKASGKPLEWHLTQKDFVETMLGIELFKGFSTGDRYATADEIAEFFLHKMYIDMQPYPDFRSMRLALEKDCDPEGWLRNLKAGVREQRQMIQMFSEAGISFAKPAEGEKQDMDSLQYTVDRLRRTPEDAKKLALLNPPCLFATLPDEFVDKIKWHATQTEFLVLAQGVALLDIPWIKKEKKAIDSIGEQLLRFVDIDLSPYPDFRSMRIVLESGMDLEQYVQKGRIIEEINNRQPVHVNYIPFERLSPYARQTEYHMDVAQALALRIGDRDLWNDIALLFDMLFVTDEMIADPGW